MSACPRLQFVYCRTGADWGSTIMRTTQLAQIVGPYLVDRYDIGFTMMPEVKTKMSQVLWARKRPKGDVLFFSKQAAQSLLIATRWVLKRRRCTILVDYVDAANDAISPAMVDVHLACSYGQKAMLDAKAPSPGVVRLLLHNPDSRLYALSHQRHEATRQVYCGSESVGFLPEEIRGRLKIIEARSPEHMEEALRHLPGYNLHYAVRSDEKNYLKHPKPLTKGFTAALARSNIIIGRDTNDVIAFLGADYPYLVAGPQSAEILDTMDRAAHDFGGPVWNDGLEVMLSVANRVSPTAIASQLDAILREVVS